MEKKIESSETEKAGVRMSGAREPEKRGPQAGGSQGDEACECEPSGRMYGYARVSTREQNLDRQLVALMEFGLERRSIYCDNLTCASAASSLDSR